MNIIAKETGEGYNANDNVDDDFRENDQSLCHTNIREEQQPLNAREIISCWAFWKLWLPTLLNVATASGLKFAVSRECNLSILLCVSQTYVHCILSNPRLFYYVNSYVIATI